MTAHPVKSKAKRQRILISGGMADGGMQTHVTHLCRVLLQAGAGEITVASASTNWPDEALADLKALGVRIIVSPFGFGAFRILQRKAWAVLLWPFLLRR